MLHCFTLISKTREDWPRSDQLYRWSLIAAQMPGRTDNDIKNHWNTRLKKKLCDMGIDPVTHKRIADVLKELAGTMAHPTGQGNQVHRRHRYRWHSLRLFTFDCSVLNTFIACCIFSWIWWFIFIGRRRSKTEVSSRIRQHSSFTCVQIHALPVPKWFASSQPTRHWRSTQIRAPFWWWKPEKLH